MRGKGHWYPNHGVCTWSAAPLGEARHRRLVEHLLASRLLDRNGRNRSVWSELQQENPGAAVKVWFRGVWIVRAGRVKELGARMPCFGLLSNARR